MYTAHAIKLQWGTELTNKLAIRYKRVPTFTFRPLQHG